MMDAKKSKRSKAVGEPIKSAYTSTSPRPFSPTNSSKSRPSTKDRVKSTPPPTHEAFQKPQIPSNPSSRWTSPPVGKQSAPTPGPEGQGPRSSRSNSRSFPEEQTAKPPIATQELTVAVLGADGVGKSTFVQLALDLRKPSSSPLASKKVSLEGIISTIRLIEVDIDDVEISGDKLVWPDEVGDESTPRFDGVLLMYNVLDPGSTAPLPPILNSLCKDCIPTIVVASNCDNPPRNWRVEYGKIEKLCARFKGIECFQTTINAPETHKRCVSIILRNVMQERQGKHIGGKTGQHEPPSDSNQHKYHQRPRTVVSDAVVPQPRNFALPDRGIGHQRAHSEALPSTQTATRNHPALPSMTSRSKAPQEEEETSSGESDSASSAEDDDSEDDLQENSGMGNQITPSTTDTSSTRIATDDGASSAMESRKDSDPIEGDGSGDYHKGNEDEIKEGSVKFEELVDRLVLQQPSKTDPRFITIFLCLYRKFATPSDLLSAIIRRFEELSVVEAPPLVRMTSQLRILAVIKEWIADYSGDFCNQDVRRMATTFVQSLASTPAFAASHKEISQHLVMVGEDDDLDWAYTSKGRSRASTNESHLTRSSVQTAVSTITADSSTEDVLEQSMKEEEARRQSSRISSTSSAASNLDGSSNQSPSSSLQTSLHSLESAQSQAQLLNPIPRIVLDKIRWHQIMDISDELIARELTRVDWILYSSIRPRDLVRQVSLNAAQKEDCKSLEHVNRMINQFNHVAFWVAHWILLRDKPKHRARALEKFMGVAWKLRHLNNYNALGAVLAGINGTAVHRLMQTRELIPPEARKQFMRLEILMGTQRSHFAYRLAWENTSTPRIPFLPLHRRDLVHAEEANRTLISAPEGDQINWRKFEVMGQVIVEIRKSQQQPYPPASLKKNEEIQRLLLDGVFSKDDDELYERSIQIEKPGAGEVPRKKFNLFQR